MRIETLLEWNNDLDRVIDAVIDRIKYDQSRFRNNGVAVRDLLFTIGRRAGIRSLKKLANRFHERIKSGNIPPEYGFYSSASLPPTDPRIIGLREGVSVDDECDIED